MPGYRSQSRSPAVGTPLLATPSSFGSRTPTFQPPSYYAAAAGIPPKPSSSEKNKNSDDKRRSNGSNPYGVPLSYPTQSETKNPGGRDQRVGVGYSVSGEGSSSSRDRASSLSRSLSRGKSGRDEREKNDGKADPARSRTNLNPFVNLPMLETQLLPSLRDTIDRMTHPQSSKPPEEESYVAFSKSMPRSPHVQQAPLRGVPVEPAAASQDLAMAMADSSQRRTPRKARTQDNFEDQRLARPLQHDTQQYMASPSLRAPAGPPRATPHPSTSAEHKSRRIRDGTTEERHRGEALTPSNIGAEYLRPNHQSPMQMATGSSSRNAQHDDSYRYPDSASATPRIVSRSPQVPLRYTSPHVSQSGPESRSGIPRPQAPNGKAQRTTPTVRNDADMLSPSEDEGMRFQAGRSPRRPGDRSPNIDRSGTSRIDMRLTSFYASQGPSHGQNRDRNVGLGLDMPSHRQEYDQDWETSEDDDSVDEGRGRGWADRFTSQAGTRKPEFARRERSGERKQRDALAGIVDGLDTQFAWYPPSNDKSRLSQGESEANTSGVGLAIGDSSDLRRSTTSARSRQSSAHRGHEMPLYDDYRSEGDVQDGNLRRSRGRDRRTEDESRTNKSARRSMSQPPAIRQTREESGNTRTPRADTRPDDGDHGNRTQGGRKGNGRHEVSVDPYRREEHHTAYLQPFGRVQEDPTKRQKATVHDAARREREGFGIPTSLSFLGNDEPDEPRHLQRHAQTTGLSHAESDLSTLTGTTWEEPANGTGVLSKGAEALFSNLSGESASGETTRSRKHRRRGMTMDEVSRPTAGQAQHLDVRRAHPRHSRSFSEASSAPSIYDDHQPTPPMHDSPPSEPEDSEVGGWRSTMNPDAYHALLRQYGRLEMRRQNAIFEFFAAEDIFTSQLRMILRLFIRPLRHKDSKQWIPGVPAAVTRLFDWFDDIINLHLGIAISIKTARRTWREDGIILKMTEIFLGFTPRLEIYQPYLARVRAVVDIISQCTTDTRSEFGQFVKIKEQDGECGGWTLPQLLHEPVEHLATYPEVFLRILQLTPRDHIDHLATLSLYHSSKMAMRVMNEVRRREEAYEVFKQITIDIEGLPATLKLANRERHLLWQGQLAVSDAASVPQDQDGPSRSSAMGGLYGTPKIVIAHASPNPNQHRSEAHQTQIYILNDLILFTVPTKRSRRRDARPWKLVGEIGIAKLLGLRGESSGNSELVVDVLPVSAEELDIDDHSYGGTVTSLRLSIPRDDRGKDVVPALQRCYAETLRSLAFPSSSVQYLRVPTDLEVDTQQSVKAITSSGLPMPKSPSVQMQELHAGVASNVVDQEREERGWWSLRYQQVLGEIRRQDPLVSLDMARTFA